ncbi:MAG: hypothetical protein O6853_08405 [Actinobacteria bacterium]|jgi:hypothetical protein|nr:hypothetical protein [Actinomycetota bacterium]MCZ6519800.1 hypothetical protein [Actinomycetota bacterium]
MSEHPSGWAMGLTAFAGLMMLMLGGWWVIAGLVAIVNSDFYVVTQDWIFQFSTTSWGWIHLILGVLVLFAGIGLFSGAVWARTVGVILAVISGLVAFAWLPWYPVWAILFVTLSVFTVWALTAHGRDITTV